MTWVQFVASAQSGQDQWQQVHIQAQSKKVLSVSKDQIYLDFQRINTYSKEHDISTMNENESLASFIQKATYF